jgi:hypothetical protein
MATKTAKKKATTVKKAPVAKKTSGKGILYERYPEGHRATGKYKFFYILFAVTTVIFAILSVILLITSIDIYNEYSSIKACNRNHKTCVVKYFDESGNEIKE